MRTATFHFSESGGSLNRPDLFTELPSCRNPYQTPDSLNCLPPFHRKPLFFVEKCFVASPPHKLALFEGSDIWPVSRQKCHFLLVCVQETTRNPWETAGWLLCALPGARDSRPAGVPRIFLSLCAFLFPDFNSGAKKTPKKKTHKQIFHGIVPDGGDCFYVIFPPYQEWPPNYHIKLSSTNFCHPPSPVPGQSVKNYLCLCVFSFPDFDLTHMPYKLTGFVGFFPIDACLLVRTAWSNAWPTRPLNFLSITSDHWASSHPTRRQPRSDSQNQTFAWILLGLASLQKCVGFFYR